MPPNTKKVDASTRWGNPHRPAKRGPEANAEALNRFEHEYLPAHPELVAAARAELRGFNLACWCPLDLPCHADVWLRIANPTNSAEADR